MCLCQKSPLSTVRLVYSLSTSQSVPWIWTSVSSSKPEWKQNNSVKKKIIWILRLFVSLDFILCNISVSKIIRCIWMQNEKNNNRTTENLIHWLSVNEGVQSNVLTSASMRRRSVTALATLSFIYDTAVTINSRTNSLLSLRKMAFILLNAEVGFCMWKDNTGYILISWIFKISY